MPDGTTYFDVARTLPRESGGYHAQRAVHAIQSPLVIDENVRGASFYASTSEE